MIVTAKLLLRIRNLNHEVDKMVDGENRVVLNRILGVNNLDKRPKFLNYFDIVRADPKIGAHYEIFEKRFTKTSILQCKTELCQNLNCFAVYNSEGQSLQNCKNQLKKLL